LVLVSEQCEHVHLGLPALDGVLPIGLRIPSQRLRAVESDGGETLLMPALNVGGGLDLDGHVAWVEKIARGPLVTHTPGRTDGVGDQVLRKDPAGRIAHDIRGALLPEAEEVEAERTTAIAERLVPCPPHLRNTTKLANSSPSNVDPS